MYGGDLQPVGRRNKWAQFGFRSSEGASGVAGNTNDIQIVCVCDSVRFCGERYLSGTQSNPVPICFPCEDWDLCLGHDSCLLRLFYGLQNLASEDVLLFCMMGDLATSKKLQIA